MSQTIVPYWQDTEAKYSSYILTWSQLLVTKNFTVDVRE